jgi:hypothetical protein
VCSPIYDGEDSTVTSEDVYQTGQKRLKSDFSFKEHRIVCGTEVTLILKNNGDILTEPVRVGHTQIKTSADIRAGNNSSLAMTSRCSVLKERPRVSDCLPQKFACKITETEDNFRWASDGNNDCVPASNPDEINHLQNTIESTPDSKYTPRKEGVKRKNIGVAGGPPPKRSLLDRITSKSLENSKMIVQAPGSDTNEACSDLSKTKGTSCLSSESANYVLNNKGDDNDSALNSLSEEDEDKEILELITEEDSLWELEV